jgi:outer membrane biosynthesis protein TonB
MTNQFDNERHRKAFIYTAVICSALLIAFIFISWKTSPPAPPVVQNEMEINLGNDDEGFGDVQPLIKGERSPEPETTPSPPEAQPIAANEPVAEENVTPDDNAPEEAAPVVKTVKKPTPTKVITPTPVTKPTVKPTTPAPVVTPTPKPRVPKVVYTGPGKGGGNNATTDNGYTMEGNKKGGTGDAGSPNGNKDTYGNKPGGGTVGPRVISGNRRIIQSSYNFSGDLDKATINAMIKVSTAGIGTFVRFGQGSTSTSALYSNDIKERLKTIKFNTYDEESLITVQFNFNVK